MTFDPKWDKKYAVEEYLFGRAPNDFLRSQHWRIDGRRVLSIGDGEGRNSAWLATKGFDVTAVEGSAVGVEKAKALASEAGVSVQHHVCDLLDWDWPVAAFDAVASIFVHFADPPRREVHDRIRRTLRPGGLLLVEAFHKRQFDEESGGPPLDLLYDAPSLHEGFLDFTTLEAFEGRVLLKEGARHSGPGEVIRLVAQKPR